MRFGSLFSGIGGLDLGLERVGMTCAWQVEIDDYCRKVLAKHWPAVVRFGDIKELSGDELGPVDLVCGGFPCQPVSFAGRRRAQDDERWLWPEFARILRVVRPRFALLENVPGLLTAGFGDVAADLADLGYDFEWDCIPAAAVGAPHLRYRVFVVAHTDSQGEPGQPVDAGARPGVVVPLAYANSERPDGERESGRTTSALPETQRGCAGVADPDAGRRDGWSGVFWPRGRGQLADGDWWATEPDVGRVAHGVPRRVDRLRALGNAVVPQVAEFIGRRIIERAA